MHLVDCQHPFFHHLLPSKKYRKALELRQSESCWKTMGNQLAPATYYGENYAKFLECVI